MLIDPLTEAQPTCVGISDRDNRKHNHIDEVILGFVYALARQAALEDHERALASFAEALNDQGTKG